MDYFMRGNYLVSISIQETGERLSLHYKIVMLKNNIGWKVGSHHDQVSSNI